MKTPEFDPVGYTFFSLEDEDGNNAFEIKYFLEDTNFSAPESYTVRTEMVFYGASLASESFQINIGSKRHKALMYISIPKVDTYLYRFYYFFFIFETRQSTHLVQDYNIDTSKIVSVILGHKKAPFNRSQLAHFFDLFQVYMNSKHTVEGTERMQLFKKEFLPSSRQTFTGFEIWLPPEDPVLVKEYQKKLKKSSKNVILFQLDGCPSDCEICRNKNVCIVCRSGYHLSSYKTCEIHQKHLNGFIDYVSPRQYA